MPTHTKFILFLIMMLVFYGCGKYDKQNIPLRIKKLKKLTVYPADSKPSRQIKLQKERAFGNTDEHPFGRLGSIAVDHTGRVYIADTKQWNIKVFSPEGHFLTQLGRKGKGPGEFVDIINLQIKDHKLFAYDNRQQSAVVFSLDSLAYSYSVKLADNSPHFKELDDANQHRYYVRNDATFLMEFTKFHPSKTANIGDTLIHTGLYYLLNKQGDITSKKKFEMKDFIQLIIPMGKGRLGVPVDFYGKSLTAISNKNQTYLAWSKDFLVKIYSTNGDYLRAFYYPYDNVPLDKRSIAHDVGQQALQKMDPPKTQPALHTMLFDDQNRLWVATIVKDENVYQWWVLDEKGRLLAWFTWPRTKPIEAIKNGSIYTIETKKGTGLKAVLEYKIVFKKN